MSFTSLLSTIDNVENSTPIESITQLLKRSHFPEFIIETARQHSFDGWPTTVRQTPIQLSGAGFFYTKKDDRIICFSCGGGLCDWEKEDDPWEQHALWYSKCDYLQMIKGAQFIEAINRKLMKNTSKMILG